MIRTDFRNESVAQIENSSGQRSVFRWLALLMSRLMPRRRRAATRARIDFLDDRMLRDVGLRRDQLSGNVEPLSHSHHGPRFL